MSTYTITGTRNGCRFEQHGVSTLKAVKLIAKMRLAGWTMRHKREVVK